MPPEWLALFPEGGEIGPAGFDLPRFGQPALDSPVPGANVGDYVVLDDGRGAMVVDERLPAARPVRAGGAAEHRRPRWPHAAARDRTGVLPQSTYLASHWPGHRAEPLNSPPVRPAGRRDRPGPARVAGRSTHRVTRVAGARRGGRDSRRPAQRHARPRPRRVRAGRHLGRDRRATRRW